MSFPYHYGSNQCIACSSAQNDCGLFELDFRDERYLPFEGCGAISEWELELPQEEALRQFDYETISDVIFHIKYTAKEDINLKDMVVENLLANLSNLYSERVFSLRHEFPTQWHRFLQYSDEAELALQITKEMFPFFTKSKILSITKLKFFVKCKEGKQNFDIKISPFKQVNEQVTDSSSKSGIWQAEGNEQITIIDPTKPVGEPEGWRIESLELKTPKILDKAPLQLKLHATTPKDNIEDIYLSVLYKL
jgi:hypothetical protein